ncbi:MAG: integrase core domain-containing protein, partial [Acidobacteria bacterium]|nr:integrase core domain-containing protein [Acidobacteriota bacterium]
RAFKHFEDRGVLIKRAMTDNGPCYLSNLFRETCTELQVKHIRTKPYTPRTNGKAERFIQTLQREWAYRFSYQSSEERNSLLPSFIHFYNHHREHSSLSKLPPINRLTLNNLLRFDN